MRTPKAIKAPTPSAPVPVPQLDSPELIDVQRERRRSADDREGTSSSLLSGSAGTGDRSSAGTKRKRLGVGALAY